jgi:uridine phosphorylase
MSEQTGSSHIFETPEPLRRDDEPVSTEEVSYPNYRGKHAHEAFFAPSDFLAYLRQTGDLELSNAPDGIILCYQRRLLNHVLDAEGLDPDRQPRTYQGLVTLPATDHRVGVVGGFGIGAPVTAALLEELIALGTRRFISIGTAGSLQRSCPVGHTIVCERAVRDEGVSHHYLPPGKFALSAPGLTSRLVRQLQSADVEHTAGSSWTIDTPYRETVEELRHYQAEGVLCVEMEAAALFAVAAYREVDVAAGFVVSDSLADLVWDPQFHAPETLDSLIRLYEASVATLMVDGPAPGG